MGNLRLTGVNISLGEYGGPAEGGRISGKISRGSMGVNAERTNMKEGVRLGGGTCQEALGGLC